MRTGVEGCGVVLWFGKYTDIAFLVSLFGFTQPILDLPTYCTYLFFGLDKRDCIAVLTRAHQPVEQVHEGKSECEADRHAQQRVEGDFEHRAEVEPVGVEEHAQRTGHNHQDRETDQHPAHRLRDRVRFSTDPPDDDA